jgi:hypothetical protein
MPPEPGNGLDRAGYGPVLRVEDTVEVEEYGFHPAAT